MHTLKQHAQMLANYLPGGKIFKAKSRATSNLYKLLVGMASEIFTADNYVTDFNNEIIPDKTQLFIDEWEKALAIPDECLPGTGTIDERREHILAKLAALGVQTEQDFIDLAATFGLGITVTNGADDVFPSSPTLEDMFTIIITFTSGGATFPLTFPIPFGTDEQIISACLLI